MAGRRADTLLQLMQYIEGYTLQRAWSRLSDDELFWEPIPGSWGVRKRGESRTTTPFGEADWVCDFEYEVAAAALEGKAVEPMTTIGWLLWHIGSQPGRLAELDILGGTYRPDSGWTSPYLTHHPVFSSATEGVHTMQVGWQALRAALEEASDDQLERTTAQYSYGTDPPRNGLLAAGREPGPDVMAFLVVVVVLNEVSHHASQMGVLRDLYRARRST